MKRGSLKLLTLFMSLNILFSATGYALFEHTCHSIGHTTHGFSEQDFCNMESDEVDTSQYEVSFKQSPCCETSVDYERLSLVSVSSFNTLDLPVLNICIIPRSPSFSWVGIAHLEEGTRLPFSKAPPNTGRDILIDNQSFVI
jgi:hypothetical protein